MGNLFENPALVSAFVAWLIAQFVKPFIAKAMGDGFNYHMFFSTGGMPSSHTSTVMALTTSIALTRGLDSYAFAISLIFALIVIHDSMNLRMEAGKQADVINEWSRILTELFEDKPFKHEHLKTMLGHSFSQVFAGFILGILTGLTITWLMQPW